MAREVIGAKANADISMISSFELLGNVTEARVDFSSHLFAVSHANALWPILVTEAGMEIDWMAAPANAWSLMVMRLELAAKVT